MAAIASAINNNGIHESNMSSNQADSKSPRSKKRSSPASANNSSDGPSPKKKASPKKKNTSKQAADIEVKTEHDEEASDASAEPGPSATSTPSKKGAKGAKATTPRKRTGATTETNGSRGIPKSWENASAEDRMLYKMKEGGSDWKSISKAWKDMTGEERNGGTLKSRYNRIKCNMMQLDPGHARVLLEVKAQVEHDFETAKWTQIAAGLNNSTGKSYQTEFLKKQVKELDAKGGLAALPEEEETEKANGHADADVDGDIKEEEGAEDGDVAVDGDASMADE